MVVETHSPAHLTSPLVSSPLCLFFGVQVLSVAEC